MSRSVPPALDEADGTVVGRPSAGRAARSVVDATAAGPPAGSAAAVHADDCSSAGATRRSRGGRR